MEPHLIYNKRQIWCVFLGDVSDFFLFLKPEIVRFDRVKCAKHSTELNHRVQLR